MPFYATLAIVLLQAICIGYSCILGAKLCDKLYAMNHFYPVLACCLAIPLILLALALVIYFNIQGDLAMTLEIAFLFFVGGICERGRYHHSGNHRK